MDYYTYESQLSRIGAVNTIIRETLNRNSQNVQYRMNADAITLPDHGLIDPPKEPSLVETIRALSMLTMAVSRIDEQLTHVTMYLATAKEIGQFLRDMQNMEPEAFARLNLSHNLRRVMETTK